MVSLLSSGVRVGAFVWFAASAVVAQEATIATTAEATKPLQVGQAIPRVSVKTTDGQNVALSSLHKTRPVVLVFFRGGWCPICTRHTQQLMKAYPRIKAAGAELVGISPDSPTSSNQNQAKHSIPFSILSDADAAAMKAFGLAFELDAATLKRYQGFGIDVEQASGYKHHALPIPAVYIVDRTGKVVYAHSDPNYRERLEPQAILDQLSKLPSP